MTIASTPCARCHEDICDIPVRGLGGAFHPNCFTCIDCNELVTSKYFPDESKSQPLCERDFFRRLDLLCEVCGQALRDSYVTAVGKKYHREHFACSACHTVFEPEDSYYEHDGKVYCHYDYSNRYAYRCAGCEGAILKQYVEIEREETFWHPECYTIYKHWTVKVAHQDDTLGAIKQQGEPKDTRSLIKQQQELEDKVIRISQVLTAYEESSAACISDMFLSVPTDLSSLDANNVRLADRFLIHIETLFSGIDKLEYTHEFYGQTFEYTDGAKMLCKKVINFITLLSSERDRKKKAYGITEEIFSLVRALAYYLKNIIRVALKAALRLEYLYPQSGAVRVLLDALTEVSMKSPGAHRPLVKASDNAGRCLSCKTYVEGECIRQGDQRLWHMTCFQCGQCQRNMSARDAATFNASTSTVLCTTCTSVKSRQEPFVVLTRLTQYAFLLRLTLSRLCDKLKITDLEPPSFDLSTQTSSKEPIKGVPPASEIPSSVPVSRKVSKSFKSAKRATRMDTAINTAPNPDASSPSRAVPARLDSLIRRIDQRQPLGPKPRRRDKTPPPVPSFPSHANRKYPCYLSELSALQYMIVRHVAMLHLEPLMRDKLSMKELRSMIETKKAPFWDRFFTPFRNKRKDNRTFGVPLDVLVERRGVESNLGAGPSPIRIASFVDEAIATMRIQGITTEGVFRKNGNIRRLRELTEQLDESPQDVDLSSETVVQVAALLKKFLRELPDPLLTFRMYDLFITIQHMEDATVRRRAMHLACCMLPRCNRDTMEALFLFLRWTASFSHVTDDVGNRMDIPNLARVIAPNILTLPPKENVPSDSFAAIGAVETLLEFYDEFCLVPDDFDRILVDCQLEDKPPEPLLKKVERLMKDGPTTSVAARPSQCDVPATTASLYAPQQFLPFANNHPSSDCFPSSYAHLRSPALSPSLSPRSLTLPPTL